MYIVITKLLKLRTLTHEIFCQVFLNSFVEILIIKMLKSINLIYLHIYVCMYIFFIQTSHFHLNFEETIVGLDVRSLGDFYVGLL